MESQWPIGDQKFLLEQANRSILVCRETDTNPGYGCSPEQRPLAARLDFGVVNSDKPAGPTSFKVSERVKRLLRVKKTGHSGTLDPNVTGVLPIGLGRGTRVLEVLLHAGKEYVATMRLHKTVSEEHLRAVCAEFVGPIEQLPPVRSRVKRVWRARSVYYFVILGQEDRDIHFRVGCQAGTYIRKLVHDLGERLGVGAHMTQLRRTRVGPFDAQTLVTLEQLKKASFAYHKEADPSLLEQVIQPMEAALALVPKVWVLDATVGYLCHGRDLAIPGIARLESGIATGAPVAVMTLKGELVALGQALLNSDAMVENPTGLAVQTHKVFMAPEVYPIGEQ